MGHIESEEGKLKHTPLWRTKLNDGDSEGDDQFLRKDRRKVKGQLVDEGKLVAAVISCKCALNTGKASLLSPYPNQSKMRGLVLVEKIS